MAQHRVTINLTDAQEEFIKKLIEYDRKHQAIRYSVNEELEQMAKLALKEMMGSEFYKDLT